MTTLLFGAWMLWTTVATQYERDAPQSSRVNRPPVHQAVVTTVGPGWSPTGTFETESDCFMEMLRQGGAWVMTETPAPETVLPAYVKAPNRTGWTQRDSWMRRCAPSTP